jgi:prepilin-type N-terminal cleavage/methylation domain-containing protein
MRSRRGFTLIELLVVIAIIGILIGIVRPMVSNSASQTRQFECESNLRQIGMALHAYAQDYGAFPDDLDKTDTMLQDKALLLCPKTSRRYYYAPPTDRTTPDDIIASCIDPRRPLLPLPHGPRECYLGLTQAGSVRKVGR